MKRPVHAVPTTGWGAIYIHPTATPREPAFWVRPVFAFVYYEDGDGSTGWVGMHAGDPGGPPMEARHDDKDFLGYLQTYQQGVVRSIMDPALTALAVDLMANSPLVRPRPKIKETSP